MSAIERLLKEPQAFDFFQAVRLLERWLLRHGGTLERDVLFQNSVELAYPASQIEALWLADADGDAGAGAGVNGDANADICVTEADLARAVFKGTAGQLRMTPALIGLLGSHGVLPVHYSEQIAAQLHVEKEQGGRAFLDLFSNRLVGLFYQAWRKYRLELSSARDGHDRLLPLLLALSGGPSARGTQPVPDAVAAYYTAAFRQRPSSAVAMQLVLQDYFKIPVEFTSCVGYWHPLEPAQRFRLGGGVVLGQNVILGTATWRRDLRAGVRLGPLTKAQFDHFLPDAPGALALKNLLSMFAVPTLQFDVRLVLRAADVPRLVLGPRANGEPGVRLSMDTFLIGGPSEVDRDDVHYLVTLA